MSGHKLPPRFDGTWHAMVLTMTALSTNSMILGLGAPEKRKEPPLRAQIDTHKMSAATQLLRESAQDTTR
jgi:hypothetical protein